MNNTGYFAFALQRGKQQQNRLLGVFFLFICLCLHGSVCGAGLVPISQPGPVIDVEHYAFEIRINDENDTLKGRATIRIKFVKDADHFQLNLSKKNSGGKGMVVSAVTEDGKMLPFVQESDAVNINSPAKENSVHTYTITYQGIPGDGLIISANRFGHRTFFGDNWPDNAHGWLPCNDNPADKASVEFTVTAPDHYQVVSNGLMVEEKLLRDHLKLTHWNETAQLPTKVMVIGVADFAIDHTADVDKIPVYSYVFPEDKNAGFKNYAIAKDILAFYIKKIGPYPYEKLANVQSKTKFGGMENASAIFYMENSVNDGRGIEVLMAHEIAHQWFGDAASEKSFNHLWLSEGFATFMTNVYLENKYGPQVLKKHLAADRLTAFDFEKTTAMPVVDTAITGNFSQLLNANSYQKGGWVLHMLRQKLGEQAFWNGIRNYYTKYNGSNANTNDLREVMEQASGQNLQQFFDQWVYTAGHPQLSVIWKYNPKKGLVAMQVIQRQNALYQLPLEVAVDHRLYTIDVKDKITKAQFIAKQKPSTITIDPNVNLLAEFKITASR